MTNYPISLIVPAAGLSTRMGSSKCLLKISGTPLIKYVVNKLYSIPWGEMILILGHEAEKIYPVLRGEKVMITYNPRFQIGLNSSIQTGLSVMSPQSIAFGVFMGDMPETNLGDIRGMIKQFFDTWTGSPKIVFASFKGQQGHPVLYSRNFATDFNQGKSGKEIMKKYSHQTTRYDWSDASCLLDLDTPTQYNRYTDQK